nr:RNA-directed DNA polymerase, eukaryota [Tanacetum cinerariifolium]
MDQGCASEEDFMTRRNSLSWEKRRQLAIRGILKNGKWIEAPDIVKEEFLMHFRNRFKKLIGPPTIIDSLSFNPLSQTHRDYLELPFSRDEIKTAVWDCGGDRAPGPMDSLFVFLPLFGTSLTRTCLIGCQYKIIGKLLANRLSNVIGDCVSPVQSAFIKGRYILDGPLILNEILAEYRQQHKELFLFKVNFEKAFDSVRWDFLDEEFELFKGLRQRDPLSPFLFILAMEGLHSLTCKAEELGLFKGLNINVDKSNVLGVGVSDEEISQMARIIGCEEHGHNGCVLNDTNRQLKQTTWGSILSSVKRLNDKGIDLLSLCSRKLGNGESTQIWEDTWCGNTPFKLQFLRIYNLDTERNFLIANRIPLLHSDWSTVLRRIPKGDVELNQFEALKAAIGNVFLTDQIDTWQWTLNVAAGYSVASA